MSGQAPSPVVVFDFDLTLTHWDTAERFFRWSLRRSAWRLAILALALPVLGPLWLFRRTRRWPVWFAVWVATLGRSPGALAALVEAHVRAMCERDAPPVFVAAAVERVREHLARGDRVVVATGCFEALARALLDRAGLAQVDLVASSLRPCFGGLVRDQHCFGANKIPMLTARGFAPPWPMVYTDHQADLPILRHGAERFLVSPRPECLARIREELPEATTVLAWR